ncbi:3-carboxyethylcatechol 2,3-dioxygenase [Rhodococcus rhodnii]|uniref:2,3-dihydroxyphenylpropionate/2,3-dihydroxicinnamic acid 1,2-dioxygenase n=2 Tax=Rhodococcus rhodnii TaxID=38312 RepID=R7WTH5_9NOCA|nr:3-carboxyethylcatechol 2,3-dioxygenase [Rhodococcus rhodnii]EOM78553.1 3-(2,3-dihydroxyphenyl)propionate dioxygenase [Rhodococcus rhodnii LMG 5362]TXG91340.1 3-carboxyethylcatechol 2,3-dioxygenase [Rhodococcus rhodnii]
MAPALVGLSHSPLIGKNDPDADTLARIEAAVAGARAFVAEFDPELVVLYAPDHYNGFFYKEMPPFCLATEATAVGDFGSQAGPLSVDTEAAKALAKGVLDRGVDLTVSARMTVDHGFVQPLEVLFDGIDRVPVVPVFVNGVATPLCPVSRIRALGTAVGEAAAELDKRVLFLASGGLSHDPPVPTLDGAPPRVADALIEGHPPTPQQRAKGEERVVQAGRDYAAGSTTMIPINPTWDNLVLDTFESGALADVDDWSVEWMGAEGGGSSHEVRTWVAAYASLAATGPYSMASRFYEAVPEWIAGFAVTTATPR